MQQVRKWAEQDALPGETYKIMSAEQVRQLAQSGLFTIGAHTHSHPALPEHPKEFQEEELLKNKKALQELTNTKIDALAYPSGLYNDITIGVAKSLGFNVAFTTNSQRINSFQDPYQLGRYQVNDWEADRFSKEINQY